MIADSIIGKNGVVMLGNRYTYWGGFEGFHKTLLRTKTNINGSSTEFLYDYGCSNTFNNGTIKKNDNSTAPTSLLGRTGTPDYESSLGQIQSVRSYNGGTLTTNGVRQAYERTYFDQISASLDPNGWYSRFSYDKNGRLQTAWLPYDFQGDSLYPAEWSGKLTLAMPGYTIYRRTWDTLYCDGTYKPGGAVNSLDYSRMVAAKPITLVNGCSGSGLVVPPSDKKEQTLLANKMVFEYNKWYRGYCSGSTSQEIADAVKLDKAKLIMHVSKVFGSCVNFRVSVLEPKNVLNRWGDNKFDTLLAKTFVLNCSGVMTTLSTVKATGLQSNGGKRGQEVVLGDESGTVPYKQLTLDLKDILDDLIHKNWVIEVDVLTPGAEVELVSDAKDYQPRLEIEGSFKRVYDLADYTLNYTHYDSGKKPLARSIIRTKLDDSLHTASAVGLGSAPMDNKRYTEEQVWFGGDYRAAKSYEIIGDPFAPSPAKDSVVLGYTGFGATSKTSDQLGDTTSTVYDALGRPLKVYRDDGTFTSYTYQTGDPLTLVGDNDQDFYGFCSVQITTQDNGIWPEYIKEYQYYDVFGRLRREKGAYNRLTKYEYDLLGRLTTVVNPAGDTTRYWYDDYGRTKYKYQPDMGYISYAYDKLGNVRFVQSQQQSNTGQLSFTEYDDLNRPVLIGETDLDNGTGGGGGEDPPPHGIITGEGKSGGTGSVDELASLSPVANPTVENTTVYASKRERVLSFPPHPALNLNRLTDVLDGSYLHDDGTSAILTANKTVWQNPQVPVPAFWALSSLVETMCQPQPTVDAPVPPYLAHPAQQYNDPGLPLALPTSFENISRYPQNARIAIQYDELPVPGGSVWTYFPALTQWNALAPTGRVRNLKGREASVAYRQHAGEPYHFIVMSYDERGRLEALLRYTENLGFDAVYYTYNSMNAVTSVRVLDPQRQYTTWYGFNANGWVDSVWTKLSAVGTGLGITNPVYRAAEQRGQDADIVYTYTKRWQVDTMVYPLIATKVAYAYNGNMMLDSMVATRNRNLLFRQVLHYDSLDCITSQKWQHTGQNEKQHEYVYNKHKWLESAFETNSGFSQVYSYDEVGNRLYADETGRYNTYAYTEATGPNRLSRSIATTWIPQPVRYDTTNYSYNANGAVISKVSRDGIRTITETMGFDNVQGLLKKYTRTEGTVSEDWRYRSNAMGEREQKRLYASTQTATKTWEYVLLSASKQQLAVYKGIETNQTSCGSTAEAFVYLYPAEYLTTGLGDVPNLTVRPQPGGTSKKEYKIQDYLGSTRVVLDGYGGIVNQTDYKPYGEVSWQSGQTQRLSWIGKEKDKESGLSDFGVRKQQDGRFLSIDPLWEKDRSLTPYHYASNNPLIWIDPTGFTKEEVETLVQAIDADLKAIANKSFSSGNEYGFAIYSSSDGSNIVAGEYVTSNNSEYVDIPHTPGEGQVIRGSAHAHPPGDGFPPSVGDALVTAEFKQEQAPVGYIMIVESGTQRFAHCTRQKLEQALIPILLRMAGSAVVYVSSLVSASLFSLHNFCRVQCVLHLKSLITKKQQNLHNKMVMS